MMWVRSPMGRKIRLAIVSACALGAIAILPLAGGAVPTTLRVVPALLLVLALPGYAFGAALFPRDGLDVPGRLLLALAGSLGLTALGGLALNVLPVGLRAGTWVPLLVGGALAGLAIAVRRGHWRTGHAEGRESHGEEVGAFVVPVPRLRQALLLGLAVAVAALAFGIAQQSALRQPDPGFTQLSIKPLVRTPAGNQAALLIEVRNQEHAALDYRLVVRQADVMLAEWPMLALRPGEDWQATLVPPAGAAGGPVVEVLLYRSDEPQSVYRRVFAHVSE